MNIWLKLAQWPLGHVCLIGRVKLVIIVNIAALSENSI